MSRKSRPWYRAERRGWYATVAGKQVSLDVPDPSDEPAAWKALEALLAAHKRAELPPPQTVSEAVAAFLADAEPRVKPKTLKGYRWYAAQLVARFGTVHVDALTADLLEADARRAAWSSSTRHNYLSTAEAVVRFAGAKLRVRKPPKESAGAASVVPQQLFRRVLQHCSGDWYAFVLFLWHTGCRPCEAAAVVGGAVDREARVVRLKEHKTAHRGKGDRLIYLDDVALEVMTWQLARYPQGGHLFRGHRGKPFSPMAVVNRFLRISAKINHRVTAYCLRHSFASRALAAGESDAVVAHLLGHSNTAMLMRHYAHLTAHGRELTEAASRIGRPKAS